MEYFNILKSELKKGISMVKDNLTKTDLEKKLKEATSNEHCHANVSLLNEISMRTQYRADYNTILFHCLKKLSCRAEKWRKILKDLFLIEHILRTIMMIELTKEKRVSNNILLIYILFILFILILYSKRKIEIYR